MSKQRKDICNVFTDNISRPLLPAGESLPPAERRHQSYQVSEGEGEGCTLQRQAQIEEKEPVTQLYISQKQTASVVSHRDVSFSTWNLHPTVLCGKFNNYQAFYWNKTVCYLHIQVRHQWEEGGRLMTEHLTLLQLWLGLATSLGSLLGGLLTISQSRHLFISTRLLVQLAMMGAALAMFSLYCVTGYYG